MTKREAFVEKARSWLGCNESDGSHRQIIDVYNTLFPLPRGYKMSYADPWCAAFVSACGRATGMTDIVLPECSCNKMIAKYKTAGRWVEDDSYTPLPGDLVFYDWEDSGVGDDIGEADHVGIVEVVEDGYITVIEGNLNDKCTRRKLKINGRYIRGFALFSNEKSEQTTPGNVSIPPTTENRSQSFW